MYIHLSQYLFKVGSLLEASDFHRIIDNAKLNKLGGQPNTRPISSTRTYVQNKASFGGLQLSGRMGIISVYIIRLDVIWLGTIASRSKIV